MYQPIKTSLHHWLQRDLTETRRLFHGRGHLHEGLEHINIDWFNPILLITAYQPVQHMDELLSIIIAADVGQQIQTVMLQHRDQKGAPADILWGEDTRTSIVNEGALKFEVHPGMQQNAGLFLDMRPLREWLQTTSKDKKVLNLFAYTCSLSVAALAGQANKVVNVDMSKPSIKWGEKNHQLNGQDLRAVISIPHNVFRSWGRIKQYGPYDTIIIDPPTRQRGSFDAEKNYPNLLKKLSVLASPGADIFAAVNSPYLGPDFLPNNFQRYAGKCKLLGEFPASPEFQDKFPEKALKIYHFRYR